MQYYLHQKNMHLCIKEVPFVCNIYINTATIMQNIPEFIGTHFIVYSNTSLCTTYYAINLPQTINYCIMLIHTNN